ncbi:MAG TPA: response regulator [Thermoanaerobaculia bacterium]
MSGERILVVEDDRAMREALTRILGVAGFCVSAFPSAEALLESGVSAEAACLVLDIHLPGISGFELHRRITEGNTSVPVIFITGVDDDATREKAARAGADAYLAKPFPGRSLIDAVTAALHSHASNAGT